MGSLKKFFNSGKPSLRGPLFLIFFSKVPNGISFGNKIYIMKALTKDQIVALWKIGVNFPYFSRKRGGEQDIDG